MSDSPVPCHVPPGDGLPTEADAISDLISATAASVGASPQGAESCDRLVLCEFFPEETASLTGFPRTGKPGPGLPESLGWSFGVLFVHLAATLVMGIIVAILLMVSGGNPAQLATIDDQTAPYLIMLLGGDQMLFLLAALIAAWLRYGGQPGRALNLSTPHPIHVLAVIGLVLPLSSVSGEVYRLADLAWRPLVDSWPALKFLDEANTVEYLNQISGSISLPLLLLIIAVGPAIGEELVFRGVIGRGLVARWGIVPGVLMASLLFAVVHVHPVHVIAVVPIGIALHLIYLATRSFWAPVLLHFLNNAWASTASKLVSAGEVSAAAVDAAVSPTLLLASITAIVVLATLLYRTRTRYLLADSSEWSPGYITAERPPAEVVATADYGLCSFRNLVTAGSAWIAFAVAFIAELVAFAR